MDDRQLKTIRVMLVASDPDMAEAIRMHVGQAFLLSLVDTATSITEAREKTAAFLPDVILLAEPTSAHPLESDIFTFCRELAFDYPGIGIVLLLQHIDEAALEAALDSGARGVVAITQSSEGWYVLGEELESRVRQAYDMVSQQRGDRWVWNRLFDRRRSVAFISGSGGVGKSLLAALLAIRTATYAAEALQHVHVTPEIALIDADLTPGVQHLLFDIEPSHTLTDIAKLHRGLDRASARLFLQEIRFPLAREQEGRLHLLASPPAMNDDLAPTPSQIANVMSVMRNTFDLLVIDTHTALTQASWPVLQSSSHIWIVCTPDIISIFQTRRLLDALLQRDEGYLRSKLGVIINRVEKKQEVTFEDAHFLFEKEGVPVLAGIWNSPQQVEFHLNQGALYPLTHVPPKKKRRWRKKRRKKDATPMQPLPLNQAIDQLTQHFLGDLLIGEQPDGGQARAHTDENASRPGRRGKPSA